MHQAAVRFTNTGWFCARSSASRSGLKASVPADAAAGAVTGLSAAEAPRATTTQSTAAPVPTALAPLLWRHHSPKAINTSPPSASATPSGPACWASTHSSQTTAAYIGKARACLKVSIHAPGRGSQRWAAGQNASTRKGRARPRPSARNTASITAAGWASAKARAAPMKGAVQGVATTAASTPVKKLPVNPLRAARPEPRPVKLPPISNSPERFNPTRKSR
mmetsp:Transcript_23223/g.54973  ORF Transcript_23223/g.54973 Transcript_23223/m.54973 type:complete len:221 (+) Transcript_23223:2387-3049(+)